jgi:hypothetical protein
MRTNKYYSNKIQFFVAVSPKYIGSEKEYVSLLTLLFLHVSVIDLYKIHAESLHV